MKIALIGYGKMGELIAKMAQSQGKEIIAKVSSTNSFASQLDKIAQADVCIDFSHPEIVLETVKTCVSLKKPLVIGTTGWDQHQELVQQLIQNSTIPCIYSPNFSIGVNLFMKMVAHTAQLIANLDEYDIAGVEYHHKHKVDKPSGTAKALSTIIEKETGKTILFESIRCGHIPGTHTILFDSAIDSITLTHEAKNREGFADGALKAAEWIIGKKGFFTINDLLKDIDTCN